MTGMRVKGDMRGGGPAWWRGMLGRAGKGVWQGHGGVRMAGEHAWQERRSLVDGMHPTRMHSYFSFLLFFFFRIQSYVLCPHLHTIVHNYLTLYILEYFYQWTGSFG